jgi:hypothetical protein
VRRSPRLQINNKAFKPGTCADRRCLACSPAPPDILPSQIKKLGSELCSIDENLLSEQALHQMKKKTCKSVSTPKECTKQNEDGKLKKKQQLKENKVPEEEEPSNESQEENGSSQAAAAPKKSKK